MKRIEPIVPAQRIVPDPTREAPHTRPLQDPAGTVPMGRGRRIGQAVVVRGGLDVHQNEAADVVLSVHHQLTPVVVQLRHPARRQGEVNDFLDAKGRSCRLNAGAGAGTAVVARTSCATELSFGPQKDGTARVFVVVQGEKVRSAEALFGVAWGHQHVLDRGPGSGLQHRAGGPTAVAPQRCRGQARLDGCAVLQPAVPVPVNAAVRRTDEQRVLGTVVGGGLPAREVARLNSKAAVEREQGLGLPAAGGGGSTRIINGDFVGRYREQRVGHDSSRHRWSG